MAPDDALALAGGGSGPGGGATGAPAAEDDEMVDATPEGDVGVEEGGDGWTTVGSGGRSARGKGLAGKGSVGKGSADKKKGKEAGASSVAAANKTIGKKSAAATSPTPGRRLTRNPSSELMGSGMLGGPSPASGRAEDGTIGKAVTVAGGGPSPSLVRGLVGLPLTRSRSERARLLALAEDAVAADASDTGAVGTSGGADPDDLSLLRAGVPLSRSAASEVNLALSAGGVGGLQGGMGGAPGGLEGLPNVPLTRSAASQLAIDLESNMAF